jgi:hypothetical protein
MLPNAFVNKPEKPTNDELADALGPAKECWDQLIADLAESCEAGIQEWKSYSPKYGWSLRLKHKKRTIVYLAPHQGCFGVMFILGDRAVAAARQSKLPRSMQKIIDKAPRYPEGTGIRLQVKKSKDIAIVKKLAAIKREN